MINSIIIYELISRLLQIIMGFFISKMVFGWILPFPILEGYNNWLGHEKYPEKITKIPRNPGTIYSCRNLKPNSLLKKVFNDYQMPIHQNNQTPNHWDLYISCRDDYKNGTIQNINSQIHHSDQKIMGIQDKWVLGSKEKLWINLVRHYGRKGASKIMPETFLLPSQINLLIKSDQKNNNYILKKEVHQQKGLKIVNSSQEVKDSNNNQEGYVLAQVYQDNPYLYQQHKTNIRIYLLIMCNKDHKKKTAYIYRDGIVSYSDQPYFPHSGSKADFSSGVASFYTSGKLYNQGYPITWQVLRQDLPHRGTVLWREMKTQLSKVLNATKSDLCNFKFKHNNTSFELFGVDFFIDQNMKPKIIEINVGPGMEPHNAYDNKMRTQLYEDILGLIGLTKPHGPNGFEKFWDK